VPVTLRQRPIGIQSHSKRNRHADRAIGPNPSCLSKAPIARREFKYNDKGEKCDVFLQTTCERMEDRSREPKGCRTLTWQIELFALRIGRTKTTARTAICFWKPCAREDVKRIEECREVIPNGASQSANCNEITQVPIVILYPNLP